MYVCVCPVLLSDCPSLGTVTCGSTGDVACARGNYRNLSAGGAGEAGRLVINEESRWQWAGDGHRQPAGRVHREERMGGGRWREREREVRWSAEHTGTWKLMQAKLSFTFCGSAA